ncbi:hypothetical protein RIF29_15301 [Crotalaria pallida]|uniref:Uncharacterized protein n=1 Tax=Crotalaria pallida TaxID=3830 RepID=A0AAN9FEN1_CROPI
MKLIKQIAAFLSLHASPSFIPSSLSLKASSSFDRPSLSTLRSSVSLLQLESPPHPNPHPHRFLSQQFRSPPLLEEDDKIIELVQRYGPTKWSLIAKSLPGRIGKQCQER